MFDHLRYCEALEVEIERFAGVVRGVDPSLPVPTCPGWDVASLVKHAGSVHRWAGAMVRDLATSRLDQRSFDLALPHAKEGYADWLASGAAPLVATLRAASPDDPMWAWGADQHVRFWSRRMLLETVVHRADAELALGRAVDIDPPVAVDGIDELLENLPHAAYCAPGVARLKGAGESLHWHATDAGGEWTIVLEADGFTWSRGHKKASVAVRAPAADLLLMAYGRRSPKDDVFEVLGDRSVLEMWLANSAL